MPSTIAQLPPHQPDEDYINKSLLASLDAQADAEPMSSSDDSDHAPQASYGSTSNSSSSGSPSVTYPISVHSHHHHLARPESPSDNHPYANMRSQEPLYTHQAHNGMYTAANHQANIHRHTEYSDEYEPVNGYVPNNYRNSFNSYPNTTRSRHQSNLNSGATYRDSATFYPSSGNDMFPGQITSPVQPHMQPYDPRVSYDYSNGHAPNNHKSYHTEQYTGTAPLIQPSHHSQGKPPQQQGQQQPLAGYSSSAQFSNGVQLSSQTPYGPHVPASVAMSGPANPTMPPGLSGSGSLAMANGASTTANGEEISTIFVVGFPEDMQVCLIMACLSRNFSDFLRL